MSRLFLPAGTNLHTDPLLAAVTNGLSSLADPTGTTVVGTPVYSVANNKQSVAYTGVAGDAAGLSYMLFAFPIKTPAELGLVTGDKLTFSALYEDLENEMTSETYPQLFIQCWTAEWGNSSNVASTIVNGRVSATTAIAADCAYIGVFYNLQHDIRNTNDHFSFKVSQPQIEKSSIPTPFFCGASTDSLNASTYAWTGSPNASTSTRAASVLKFPISIPASGTIAMTVVPTFAAVSGVVHQLAALSGGTSWASIIISATGVPTFYYHDSAAGLANVANAAQSFVAGTTHAVIARFVPAASLDICFDGVSAAQAANALTAATWTGLEIGSNASQPPSTYAGPILTSPQRKSDAWVTAVDALLRATTVDIPTLKRVYMAPGDALFTGDQADGSNLYVKGS